MNLPSFMQCLLEYVIMTGDMTTAAGGSYKIKEIVRCLLLNVD